MELSRVIIFTPDVKRLAEFYTSCFDLKQVGDANEHWTELRAGSCNIALHKIDESAPTRDGWIKIVFAAEDVVSEKERLESLGVKMSDIVRFGDIQMCDGRDPDGNFFQVSSRDA